MMKIEILVSTMGQTNMNLIEKMNIRSDALIVNQCELENFEQFTYKNKLMRMISVPEKGLSKSRNFAINNSIADICVIADDDVIYEDNFEKIIEDAYEKHPDADIIVFDVPDSTSVEKSKFSKNQNIGFLKSMKIRSVQITFKREKILKSGIKFNELFGSGSNKYICGEENIFLTKCLKKKLKIKYIKQKIGVVETGTSSWFSGFNQLFFRTKGAMFYEMSPFLSHLLILQFIIRKRSLYKSEIDVISAYRGMLEGSMEHKKTISAQKHKKKSKEKSNQKNIHNALK
jgi:glycosyltransferase involved in cell wall biosynthesis